MVGGKGVAEGMSRSGGRGGRCAGAGEKDVFVCVCVCVCVCDSGVGEG